MLGGRTLPHALASLEAIGRRLRGRRVAVFLDYDGTLTPIAPRPDLAILSEPTRKALGALAQRCPVVLVSGRDRNDVMALAHIDGLFYVGSHGLDIEAPDGTPIAGDLVRPFVADLVAATEALRRETHAIPGVVIEEKAFATSIHYRQAHESQEQAVRMAVQRVAAHFPRLRVTGGKKVWDLRPAVDWNKGTAVLALLEALSEPSVPAIPIFIGDDETDEDAFAAIEDRGIGIIVSSEAAPKTRATYRLSDPDEVRRFLEALSGMIAERARA